MMDIGKVRLGFPFSEGKIGSNNEVVTGIEMKKANQDNNTEPFRNMIHFINRCQK